jgi:hypothetical protein
MVPKPVSNGKFILLSVKNGSLTFFNSLVHKKLNAAIVNNAYLPINLCWYRLTSWNCCKGGKKKEVKMTNN